MLMHGCVGESIGPRIGFPEKEANVDIIDVTISARYSTLPFDNDKMSGWIRLVQVAKGMPVCYKERVADCIA